MTATTLKLAQLRFGHDPLAGPTINARTTGRLTGIDEMAAMLASQGQIERVLVVHNPTGKKEGEGLYFTVNGNRRLAAMQKHWAPDAPVLAEIAPNAERALEMSLATNTTLPMHPVDRYRAYAEVIKRDKIDGAQLARRFGVSAKEMQKSLALGALSDDVLEAWLAGIIPQETAAVFTLQPDKKEQAHILAAALKQGGGYRLEPKNLRSTILGKRKDVGKLIAFVGVDEYRKAGGKLDEDLFGTGHVAHNPEIAVKLAKEKLAAACADLVTVGWAWALPEDDMPDGWSHRLGYGRIDRPKKTPDLSLTEQARRAELLDAVEKTSRGTDWDAQMEAKDRLGTFDSRIMVRGYAPAKMATAGCVVSIGDDGEIEIAAGVLKPEAKKAVEKTAKAKEKAAKPGEAAEPKQIPASLAQSLSEVLTRAAAKSMAALDTEGVLRVTVAAMASAFNDVVKIECRGMRRDEQGLEFAEALASIAKIKLPGLIEKLAFYTGMAIDMRSNDPARDLADGDVAALLGAIPATSLQTELRAEFDAADYFDRAPAAVAIAALADMGETAPKAMKKSDLAKHVAAFADADGWLPPQLRTKDYAAAPDKAAKTATKKKKPAKK